MEKNRSPGFPKEHRAGSFGCRSLQMRDDGSMDLDMIEASLPEELKAHGAMDTMKQCLPTPGKDLCQTAYDMIVCVYKTNPDLARLFD